MTYYDDEIEVEIDLSDEEVKTIKALVADYLSKRQRTHQGLVPVPLDLRRCRATKTRTRPIEKK